MVQGTADEYAQRLQDRINLGVLAEEVPRDLVERVALRHGCMPARSDAKLPPYVLVNLMMNLFLHPGDDYAEAAERLYEPLREVGALDADVVVPGSSAITQARKRLGAEVVRDVFEEVAAVDGDEVGPDVPGMVLEGADGSELLMVSFDGTTLTMPDTPGNAERFGYPGTRAGSTAAFPQLRLGTLVTDGTRGPFAAAFAPVRGKGTGERSLLEGLLGNLGAGMLLSADAGLYGYELFTAAAHTGADLLWRLGEGTRLDKVAELPDGSYLALLYAQAATSRIRETLAAAGRAGQRDFDAGHATLVRVVEYTVTDRGTQPAPLLFCLITTLLEHSCHPAPMLAAAYHRRWEHETGNKEMKELLAGPEGMLRSRLPDLVEQEVWALLLTHAALARLRGRAAAEAAVDPGRISFTKLIRIVRRRGTSPAAFSP